MVKVVFVAPDGAKTEIDALAGMSVMEVAVSDGTTNIIGDCGGNLSCATCHCYVAEPWADRLPAPGDSENAMLDGVFDRQPNSRLSCQIHLDPALDGIELRLPERQF